jgi:hypothetical protein
LLACRPLLMAFVALAAVIAVLILEHFRKTKSQREREEDAIVKKWVGRKLLSEKLADVKKRLFRK